MIKLYCEYCGKPLDEDCECARYAAEEAEQFRLDYDNSPETHAGWAQQDLIDMYRYER